VKKYSFPTHASRINGRFNRLTQVRWALIFALVAGLSCLPFYALAQDDVAAVKSKKSQSYTAYDGGAFVIYQGQNGDTICRDATPAETLALRSGASGQELHQINHLPNEFSSAPNSSTQVAANLTIILRATAQLDLPANAEAKAAFIAAAAKWETLIKDPITIIIDVDFGEKNFGQDFGANVLGSTSPHLLFSANNYPDIRNRLINRAATPAESTLYNALPTGSLPTDIGSANTLLLASPLLRALGNIPADATADTTTPGNPPRIAFNSAFAFDFDPSDGITGSRTDFDAVAVHEIGHALGFDSEVGARELDPARQLFASVWDIFRFRPATANLNNFNTAQRILSTGGTHVHFSGGPELGLSTGNPLGEGGDDEQASHWKDDNPVNGDPAGPFIGIMDPTIPRNRREVMTANDENAIDAFGYLITATTAPANDNFANAQLLNGSTGTVAGSNAFATKEPGEPTNPPNTGGGKSVWYNWTAPGTGQATFDTNGSNYDTILAVYTGTSVNALTHITSNDDIDPLTAPEPRNIQSRVTFSATAGTNYRIQVDGFDGDQGNIVLSWTAPGAPTPTPTPAPGPNTVQFSASTAGGTEADNATNRIDLTVTRTGDTAQAATVNFASSDATASERTDYEAAIGTLFFGANELSKTIPIFIVNDSYGEVPETFNITLSNPVGCTLGSPVAMAITITSNETVDLPNPVKEASFNTDFFVRQHYLDFFNREADPSGLAFWKNEIDSCGTPQCRELRRINVSGAFFLSIEFQQTGYLVERLYKVAYGDAVGTSTLGGTHQLAVPIVRLNEFLPDTQRIGKDVIIGQPGADQLLEANKQALIAEFVLRSRFTTRYPGSLTPGEFVDALSANAGAGVLSPAERNQLVNELTSGFKTRAQVLRAVAEDTDLFAAETNRAFVLAQFFGYLRRNPNDTPDADYTGYDFWLSKLNQFNGNFVNAEMVKAFIESTEYQQRFGP
jgi:Calx-beta domain-containing protein